MPLNRLGEDDHIGRHVFGLRLVAWILSDGLFLADVPLGFRDPGSVDDSDRAGILAVAAARQNGVVHQEQSFGCPVAGNNVGYVLG